MGNPYYISRERSPLLDVADLGLKLYGIKKQGDWHNEQVKLESQRNKLLEQAQAQKGEEMDVLYGKLQVAEGGEIGPRAGGLKQQELDISRRTVQAKERSEPIHLQQFTTADAARTESVLKTKGWDKAFKPILSSLKEMGPDDSFTKGEAYLFLKKNWGTYRENLLKSTSEALSKETDPMKQQQLQGLITGLEQDTKGELIDMAFPGTAQSLAVEESKSRVGLTDTGRFKVVGNDLVDTYSGKVVHQAPFKPEADKDRVITGYDDKGNPVAETVPHGYSGPLGKGGITRLTKPPEETPGAKQTRDLKLGDVENSLRNNSGDTNMATSYLPKYNEASEKRVGYWHREYGKISNTEETRFLDLPDAVIKKGWSPAVIQAISQGTGKSIQQILLEIGLLKGFKMDKDGLLRKGK